MKVSEFEAKLGTVSDDRLRQMLSASRANGPEVAVKLILEEARKRGMGDLEDSAAASATSAYPRAEAGLGDADAPAPSLEAAPAEGEAKPVPPEWLSEETKSGMPIAVKILLLLLAVGAILGLAWKFSH